MTTADMNAERLELALEAAGLDLWENDLATGKATKNTTKIFSELGYSDDEAMPYMDDIFAIVHPDDVARVKGAIEAHVTGATSQYRCEFRVRNKRGDWVWYANYGKIMDRTADNPGRRFIGVTFNIDDRKRKEQELELLNRQLSEQAGERKAIMDALRASTAQLQAILDYSSVGIWLVGLDGKYRFVNKTFCDAVGVPEHRFRAAQHLSEVLAPHIAENCISSDRACLLQDEPHLSHETLPFVDGKEHVLEITKIKLFNEAGEVSGIIGIAVDITERQQAQAALLEAKERAEAANQSKSRFLASMSHEIRTPMNTIIGMTQLALKTEREPKQRDYLGRIFHSGEHLLRVIDNILDFSKLEAEKLVLEDSDLDLIKIKQALINLVAWKATEKGIRISFDFSAADPGGLCGDMLRLNQILINYTNNAIKFTHQGEIAVRARKLDEDAKTVLLCFEVQDTGIGIPQEQRGTLFQAFHQAETSTSRTYGGSGLGLAISKRLAELMGGEVGFSSELGKGSIFWLKVRLRKCDRPAFPAISDQKQAPQAGNLAAKAAISGNRILLVEDNSFNQFVAREFLEDAGATVCIANNGKEALDLLHQEQFDCILMDSQMPVMDGLEATRLIRDNAVLRDIPIIALTANAFGEDRARCIAVGMNDFIGKPFRCDDLYTVLAKWVSR